MTGSDPAINSPAGLLHAAEVVARFPATANQNRMWQEADFARAGPSFNVAFRRRFTGRISDAAIERAMHAIVARHEILRTRFRQDGSGNLCQEVLSSGPARPVQIDLRHLAEPTREEELAKLGIADAQQPFDLGDDAKSNGLFRLLVVRTASDVAYFHFTFHQLVIDGWSIDLLVDEFARLAASHDAGSEVGLPPVEMQFGDFALWQRDVLESGALDHERRFWQDKLVGLPRFAIAPDEPDAVRDAAGMIRSLLLPRNVSDAFEALARRHDHTLFSLALSAATVALHHITGEREVVLGTQTAGRDDPDAQRIIGPLLNSLVLRLPVDPGAGFLAFADTARSAARDALAHQTLPFAEVVHQVGDDGGPERTPLFSVNLTVQRTNIASSSVAERDYGAFWVGSVPAHSTGAQWDVSLFMVGRAEGWRLSCEGAASRYAEATLDSLLTVWRKVIEAVVAQPEAVVASLIELEPHERRRGSGRPALNAAPGYATRRNPRIEAIRDRIVTLQPKGDGIAVMAINNSSVLYPVAREIGINHPFHDLLLCPSDRRVALPQRHFQDHARDAVEMIRLAKPNGPYALFGLCVFGAIAIEAARILQAEGESVPLVILNDTYRPGYRERMGLFDKHLREWQVRLRTTRALYRRFAAGEIDFAALVGNYRLARSLGLHRLVARLTGKDGAVPADPMQEHNRWFAEEVLLPSQARFAIEPYHGRVVMFRNAELAEGRLFPRDFGWSGYVDGPFEVIDCPGNHDTMFRAEGARVIGASLRAVLDGEPG